MQIWGGAPAAKSFYHVLNPGYVSVGDDFSSFSDLFDQKRRLADWSSPPPPKISPRIPKVPIIRHGSVQGHVLDPS